SSQIVVVPSARSHCSAQPARSCPLARDQHPTRSSSVALLKANLLRYSVSPRRSASSPTSAARERMTLAPFAYRMPYGLSRPCLTVLTGDDTGCRLGSSSAL